jgi:hypothetical protein
VTIDLTKLCYYDVRNPNNLADFYAKDPQCYCDNCFYGRTRLTLQLLEMEKQHKEDMLDLIQSLKDYTKEGHVILGHDEREPEEFLNIWYDKNK